MERQNENNRNRSKLCKSLSLGKKKAIGRNWEEGFFIKGSNKYVLGFSLPSEGQALRTFLILFFFFFPGYSILHSHPDMNSHPD